MLGFLDIRTATVPGQPRIGHDVENSSAAPTHLREKVCKGKELAVKYVALVYNNPGAFEALSESDRDALMREADAFLGVHRVRGASSVPAKRSPIRRQAGRSGENGVPAVTDGPFAEAKEQLAGYYMLDESSNGRPRSSPTTRPPASGPSRCARSWTRPARRCDHTGRGPNRDLLRRLAPQVLGALVRRYGSFDLCEDAVRSALAAAVQWPEQGVPRVRSAG